VEPQVILIALGIGFGAAHIKIMHRKHGSKTLVFFFHLTKNTQLVAEFYS
jgi:hypothetical protein